MRDSNCRCVGRDVFVGKGYEDEGGPVKCILFVYIKCFRLCIDAGTFLANQGNGLNGGDKAMTSSDVSAAVSGRGK